MPCKPLTNRNGNVIVWSCSRGSRVRCSSCGADASLLCDYPVKAKSGTCDRPLCHRCATVVGADKHYCPPHTRLWAKTQEGES